MPVSPAVHVNVRADGIGGEEYRQQIIDTGKAPGDAFGRTSVYLFDCECITSYKRVQGSEGSFL